VIDRHGQKWYVAGANAGKAAIEIKVNLNMLAGKDVVMYNDNKARQTFMNTLRVPDNGVVSITIQPNGGFVLV
jgi:hypothetical protein